MKNFNDYIPIYKEQLKKGDIQKAYTGLIKYVLSLKTNIQKTHSAKYSFGNISLGYMDYTYFPFSNDFLRKRELRFGIVLNHQKVRFELWLMGRNNKVQHKYWSILKSAKWNENRETMPKYSVLEVVLADNPNFSDLESLTQNIKREAIHCSEEIIDWVKNHPFE